MKAEDKLQILIFLLMLVNSLFVILGLSLFGCSAWILFDKNNFITVLSTEENVKVVAGGLFVIGLVVVGVSMLGCVGVYLENRCLIVVYMAILVAIVLGQVYITIFLLVTRNKIEAVLIKSVDAIITEYGCNDTQTTWKLLDSVQQSAKCCGERDHIDWQKNVLIQTLNKTDVYPCSCFNGSCPVLSEVSSEMYPLGKGSEIYTTGCGVKLRDWSETNIFVIVGMDLGLLAIQILQFALGIHIYWNIGLKIKNRYPKNLLNTENETPAPEPDLQQSNLEYYQPANHNYDQQLHDYDQEHAGASYQYEDQHYQHHHDPDATSHLFDLQHHSSYAQEDFGQAYNQSQQYHEPEPTSYTHNYKHEYTSDQNHIDQSYDPYQGPHYQHSDQAYPERGNYNQGFVQSYDSGNHFGDY